MPEKTDKKREAPAPGGDMLGGGNLEQVREILFGAASRSLDKRLARLEEQLAAASSEIRDELRRGIAALETFARKELDSVNERLKAEQRAREEGLEGAGNRLEETARSVKKELSALAERQAAGERDLRQLLLDQSKRLDEEFRRQQEESVRALTRALDELRAEKADRAAVASILQEVALRLTDDLTLPLGAGPDGGD